MESHLNDWLNHIVRLLHVVAAISWIGNSFYFMWLDRHLTLPEAPRNGGDGALWMVHSGGFYRVEKRKLGPGEVPKVLHWFRWESGFTWLTGIFLLGIVYYVGGAIYLVEPASKMPMAVVVALILFLIGMSWLVYDLLWKSPLGNDSRVGSFFSLVLCCLLSYSLCYVLNGRSAFIHMGAILGTLMAANVWMRILPAQREMIQATKENRTPDYTLGIRAKHRSIHNSYLTLPVLFTMISNHYPAVYAHSENWIVLILLIFLGAASRHFMLVREQPGGKITFSVIIILICLLAWWTLPPSAKTKSSLSQVQVVEAKKVSFAEAKTIIAKRCTVCHARKPVLRTFGPMPGGVSFESDNRIKALAHRIKVRAVHTKTMPMGNKTTMTEEERELLGRWIDQGAPQ